MGSELELAGPTRLTVERTQLVVVRGKGSRRYAQAVPLDMIQSVSFGHRMASMAYIMVAVLLLLAGFILFWLAPMPFAAWIYAAAGFLLAAAATALFFMQSGHAFEVVAGDVQLRLPARKKQLPAVQAFARELLTGRVDFIEGMYGEEE